MHEIGKKIIFEDIQIRRGNRQKHIKSKLEKNLAIFKTLPDDKDFDEIYDCIFNNKNTNNYISANLFPLNMNLMAYYREVGFSNCIKYELRWQMKTFSKYANEINIILSNKMMIDELVLFNQYEKALELLNVLESQYGNSYWLLETI